MLFFIQSSPSAKGGMLSKSSPGFQFFAAVPPSDRSEAPPPLSRWSIQIKKTYPKSIEVVHMHSLPGDDDSVGIAGFVPILTFWATGFLAPPILFFDKFLVRRHRQCCPCNQYSVATFFYNF